MSAADTTALTNVLTQNLSCVSRALDSFDKQAKSNGEMFRFLFDNTAELKCQSKDLQVVVKEQQQQLAAMQDIIESMVPTPPSFNSKMPLSKVADKQLKQRYRQCFSSLKRHKTLLQKVKHESIPKETFATKFISARKTWYQEVMPVHNKLRVEMRKRKFAVELDFSDTEDDAQ